MLQKRNLLLTFSLLLISVFALTALGQPLELNGEQIVQKMGQQYANSKSYQDVGEVRLISGTDERNVDKALTFKTYFLSPDNFRFEWEDNRPPNKYWSIVWSDGKNTYTYGDLNELQKKKDLMSGIAGATGVSLGAAHNIPVLLMKEVIGFRLTQMSQISLLRQEQFEGENCFVVRGYSPSNEQFDVWISKNDFLLRKVRSKGEDDYFLEDIRRNVKLNESISNEIFQYTPPPKKDSKISSCFPIFLLPLGLFLLIGVRK